ncbi:MAG: hypothetical protein LIO79_01015 [Rikenellaceae bacterium]|nr:hypothetical protein [Rikenellaceae bacterium]
MKKFILLLIIAVGTASLSRAQDYNWSIGLRGGGVSSGVTAKVSIDGYNAIEAMVSFTHGTNVYVLYERHMPIISDGFSFYYGAGGNIGSWKRHGKKKFTVGIDGILGLDYKIKNVPLALFVDYKPGLNIAGHAGFRGWYDFGGGVRLAF